MIPGAERESGGTGLSLALEQTEQLRVLIEQGEWTSLAGLVRARAATVRAALAGAPASLSGAEREQVRRLVREDALLGARACRLRDEIATQLGQLRRSRHGARQYARTDRP